MKDNEEEFTTNINIISDLIYQDLDDVGFDPIMSDGSDYNPETDSFGFNN